MAQVLEYLPTKLKALSLKPNSAHTHTHTHTHTYSSFEIQEE
jgi:hypothetical protein